MKAQHSDILIIGAGMAGLSCGTKLAQAGLSVRLIDKGRGPGGRMAARRAEVEGTTVSFDHGAQYFTARDPAFRAAVAEWEALGVVARWPAAGEEAWVGIPGMNGPIRALADTLDVRWNVRAEALTRLPDGWFVDSGADGFTADRLIVAVPASVRSEPCWAVMAAFADTLAVDADTLRDADAPISWAARNSAKPERAGSECWVLHASPARSRELIDCDREEVAPILLADFFAQAGAPPVAPIHLAAHRWLYAMPQAVRGEPARYDGAARIGIAGDYLHSPRIEGAWLSGRALAEAVLEEVRPRRASA
jgi:predicted NAD/FAD-dependent oxidoreductase